MVQQGGVIVVEGAAATAFHLVSGRRGIVAAQYLGDAAQGSRGRPAIPAATPGRLTGGDLSVAPPEWQSISWNSRWG